MADVAAFLAGSPLFSNIPSRDLTVLAGVAREQRYRPREFIFLEGDPADWFCLVRSGRVKIVRASRAGKEVVLELLGPGEPFGGVA